MYHGEPAGRRQLHLRAQLLLRERLVADDVDRGDLGGSPSTIVKLIATRLRSCGVTVVCTVAAYLPRVMYWRFSSCSARSSAERSKMRASAMPISFSAFLIVSVSNSLLPTNVERADRRPLLHDDDQHVALRLEAHVAEEAGGVERLDRLRDLFVVDALADLDRQVAEDRARFGALHAFDADVAHGEGIERPASPPRASRPPRRRQRTRERQRRARSARRDAVRSAQNGAARGMRSEQHRGAVRAIAVRTVGKRH